MLSTFHLLLRKAGSGYRTLTGRDPASVREFLARHYLRGEGLEVGALDNPMPVSAGVKVRYVDRMIKEDLLRQYPELAGKKLVSIDIVADGEILEGIGNASQDFIIANHFLEHCEDTVGTLKNFLRVLKSGGILFLSLPDKRFTFDRERVETSYNHLLQDHREGPKGSRHDHFLEWVQYVEKEDESQRETEAARLSDMQYSIHFHVFTGPSMLAILGRLQDEQGLEFEVSAFQQNGQEFVCVLQKT